MMARDQSGDAPLLTTRTQAFTAQCEAINEQLIGVVLACTDEAWWLPCAEERWPVGVVAHHIATVYQDFFGLVGALAAGQTRSPTSSMEEVDQSYAQHARDAAAVKQETLALLRRQGAALAQRLRSLSDERL